MAPFLRRNWPEPRSLHSRNEAAGIRLPADRTTDAAKDIATDLVGAMAGGVGLLQAVEVDLG